MIYVVYYIQLAILLLGAFFPQYRIWGVNWWAYFPLHVTLTLFGIGCLIPIAVRYFTKEASEQDGAVQQSRQIDKTYYIAAVSVFIVFGLSFYFLRAQTHFLGDGYAVLGYLASDNTPLKPSNFGETLIHVLVKSLIGGDPERAALLSYQILAFAAGLLFLIVIVLTARVLYKKLSERLIFLLGLSSSGFMLLFFGYVEHYSLFALAIAIFTCTGLLTARSIVNKFVIIPATFLLVFLHVFGVFFIPAAIYILLADTRLARTLIRSDKKTKFLLWLLGVVTVVATVIYAYNANFYYRFAFVPFLQDRFTVEGYTILSWKHLLDYMNLLLLLLPGLPILITLLIILPKRKYFIKRDVQFLAILALVSLAAIFVIDPKLGMPRDWDLLSFAGIPLSILAYHFLLLSNNSPTVRRGMWLIVAMGLLVLFPRVVSQVDASIAIKHCKSYFALDLTKNRNGRIALIHYYESIGDTTSARYEGEERLRLFPENTYNLLAKEHFNQGKYLDVITLSKKAIGLNPTHHESYANMGTSYLKLNQNDSALLYLEIANGLNYNNRTILANLGTAYSRKGQPGKAERYWWRAYKLEPDRVGPLVSLAILYINSDRFEESFECFQELAANENVTVDYLKSIADGYLKRKHYDYARQAYKIAVLKGLDPEYVKKKLVEVPQLR